MLILGLLACTDPAPSPDPVDSAAAAPETCDAGQVWDGVACVAERCGLARWPEGPAGTMYVDAAAVEPGDGSEARPFRTLAEGMAAAGAGGEVRVAAGTYNEPVGFEDATAGIEVRGRCPELVVIDGTGLDPEQPVVYTLGGPSRRWTLAGVGVTQGAYGGIWALDGTLVLDTVEVWANALLGVAVGDADGASMEATGLVVRDNLALDRQGGYGLYVVGGSRVTLDDARIERNPRVNVVVHDANTDLSLTDVVVREALSVSTQTLGIDVEGGATLVATRLLAEENPGITLQVGGESEVFLTDSELRGARDPNGEGGLALLVTTGSRLTVDGLSIVDADAGGAQLEDAVLDVSGLVVDTIRGGGGSVGGVGLDLVRCTGTLRDVSVHEAEGGGVQVFGGDPRFEGLSVVGPAVPVGISRGVQVSEGGSPSFLDLSLTDTTDAAMAVYGSTVTVDGGAILGTTPWGEVGGTGLFAQGGATVTLTDVEITDNRYVGLLLTDPGTQASLDGVEIGLTRSDPTFVFGRGAEVHEGARLDAVDTRFVDNQEVGVYVGGGGVVHLDHVTIEGTVPSATYVTGFGLVAQGGATATLDSVVVQANTGPGLYAAYGGAIDVFETTVLGNGFAGGVVWDGALVAVDSDFTGTVEDPSLGGGVGLFGVGGAGSAITLEDVVVSGNRYAGFWVGGEGSWTLRDVDVMGGGGVDREGVSLHGNAVFARGGARVSVEGGWLRHSRTALLLDAATAVVTGARFEDNLLDVRQQACDGVDPVDAADAATADLCPPIHELVAPLDFRVDIGEVAVSG